jgi:uncharacterized membrane protein YozB (DUF420 family)
MRDRSESTTVRGVIAGLSIAALALITWVLILLPDRANVQDPGMLPAVNASFNAGAAICLVLGWGLIKAGRPRAHRLAMLGAVGLSSAFFIGYLVHHWRVGSVPYEGQGVIRTVYFSLLLPHIVLAAPLLPMALMTLYRGLTQQHAAHRRLARWTLPIWVFVSLSGVVVFWMLYHG